MKVAIAGTGISASVGKIHLEIYLEVINGFLVVSSKKEDPSWSSFL